MSDTPNQSPEDLLDELLDPKRSRDDLEQPKPNQSKPPEKPDKPEKRNANVFGYLAILFAVAFFMLLLAYFMQQRNTEVAMNGLRDSITQFQTMDELMDENEELKGQIEDLQTQIDELEATLAESEDSVEANEAAYRDYWALSYFWMLDCMFRDGHYAECAQLLQSLNAASFSIAPSFSMTTASGLKYDARARYDEICAQLVELGYLEKAEDGSLSAVSGVPDPAE